MQCAPEKHKHVHAKVIDLKDLRLGKEQHKHSDQLRDGDPRDDRLAHVGQRGVSALHASGGGAGAEPADNVRAELNSNTNSLRKTEKLILKNILGVAFH